MKMIPSANPGANYLAYKTEIDAAVMKVLESGWYVMGEGVEQFEKEFALYLGAKHCISTGTGTDALILILRALGVGPGDAVVTVSHTAVATVSAIDLVGAHPVLVDVDPTYFTMSPGDLEETLTNWVGHPIKAIIPVHLYGQPADMDRIMNIASRFGVAVVEDCAQAHGALYRGRKVGTIGDAAAFSFYPTKNLGALGDGGAVVTSNAVLAERCQLIKQYGWKSRYISEISGMNTRLDEIQAAVLKIKLKYLDDQNMRRREIAKKYCENGVNCYLKHPIPAPETDHVFHQYVVQSEHRNLLQQHLQNCGVGTAILYPEPVHRQAGYADKVRIGAAGLKVTEDICKHILSVPIYPELSDSQVGFITQSLINFNFK